VAIRPWASMALAVIDTHMDPSYLTGRLLWIVRRGEQEKPGIR
jgi:hypothetical protein